MSDFINFQNWQLLLQQNWPLVAAAAAGFVAGFWLRGLLRGSAWRLLRLFRRVFLPY